MKRMVESGVRGVSNAKGFYEYTPEQAERWWKLFLKYTYEIRELAQKYPEDVGDHEPEPVSQGSSLTPMAADGSWRSAR